MPTGKVKWFNNAKGYGFILPDEGGGDLFAHYSVIQMDGYKTLKAGQPVAYDIIQGPKGHHAVNIVSADSVGLSVQDNGDASQTERMAEHEQVPARESEDR
ncbi:MAG: cold shock domain-containing protein CspD [Pseudomonadota bacterium]